MLYGKIYLDTIDGREALVFVSLAVKGWYKTTLAENVDNIAISPEARAVLAARLERDSATRKLERYFGDFKLNGASEWEHGSFSFAPDTEENGLRIRTLYESDILSLCVGGGVKHEVIDYMIPCDNDYLKALDLHASFDENTLWERHFTALRERGEEQTTDAETIKKTPTAFLTEAQRDTIKQDYRHRCDRYDSTDWHYHGAFLEDKIIREVMACYCKKCTDIESICGIKHRD